MRSQRFIASFLVLATVLSIMAFNYPLVGNYHTVVGHHAVDTLEPDTVWQREVRADSAVADTFAAPKDSVLSESDSLLMNLDSIKARFDREHGIDPDEPKSRATQWNDSVAAAEDSIRQAEKSKGVLEAPVVYEAKDSMTFFMGSKNAYLYGDADVKYMDIDLKAENINMDMDSSIIHAIYGLDSLGAKYGTPIFKDGGDEYELEKMSYNFKTKKAHITNVYTAQQDGFLRAEESKKGPEGEIYMRHGKYTTCDEEHPHFYIAMSRGKAHPGKDVFSGPAWLVVEDVPLPLAIPFAYFPMTKTYSSGLIMPSYGDESTRGFYLRDGGYYFALSDYMDLKLTGEIFTKGSWGLAAQTTYKKRYKFSGNFYFNYQVTKEGEKNMPDYSVIKNFKLQWSHRTDSKASPNSSFSASVNFATQSYEKNNLTSLYNPTSYSQSTRTSSVSYSHNFTKIGLSMSSSFNISQNMRDSTLALTMPSLSLSLSRFYPFKRKHAVGKERWYEKIALTYTGSLSNSISTKEDKLMSSNIIKDWSNGMKHYIPISASFNVLKYINITPSFNYTERWYTHKINQSWDKSTQSVVRDTTYGFNRVWDYNLNLSANTKVYVEYTPVKQIWGEKIQKIRHVITPTVSFSYAPDFSAEKYGYWKTYMKTDEEGNVSSVIYSPYAGSLYGTPSSGKTGAVNFDVSNNIEMKYTDKNDSTKKFSIIDELGASLSYNMAAKKQPWSNLSTRLRLKWGKTTFNVNAVFNTYAYEFDKNGNVVVGNRTEWSYGRFGRFQGMSKNLSYTFNNQSWKKIKEKVSRLFGGKDAEENMDNESNDEEKDDESLETNRDKTHDNRSKNDDQESSKDGLDADGYMKFNMPWSFSISYGITMAENRSAAINVKTMRYPYKFTHTLNFSGNVRLSDGWNISFTSGYDFEYKKLSMTTASLARDLHCFSMSASVVLTPHTSYNFTFRCNAATLMDALKYDKRSAYSNSVKWY